LITGRYDSKGSEGNESEGNESKGCYRKGPISRRTIFEQRTFSLFQRKIQGTVINAKKSVLSPAKSIEFLGITIDSEKMELSLREEKVHKIIDQCNSMLNKIKVGQ